MNLFVTAGIEGFECKPKIEMPSARNPLPPRNVPDFLGMYCSDSHFDPLHNLCLRALPTSNMGWPPAGQVQNGGTFLNDKETNESTSGRQ